MFRIHYLLIAVFTLLSYPVNKALSDATCPAQNISSSLIKENKSDIRFATFNVALNRQDQKQLNTELKSSENKQIKAVAEIIQHVKPDVILLNEFDYDPSGQSIKLFQKNYLSKSQNGYSSITYPHIYIADSNTGIPSGLDLDNNNEIGGPGDAFGFGTFPGQYGMVLLSKYPIDNKNLKTFQKFLWKDMPDSMIPAEYYTKKELEKFRLSSKSHWDVPLLIHNKTVHVLAAHPTPPVFDGEEDKNGRRNHDEIRFWADYISAKPKQQYMYDDQGRKGGLSNTEAFVIMGDYNADPEDGDSTSNAINRLLDHPAINTDFTPNSLGAIEDSEHEGGSNKGHKGNAAFDTGDFNPKGPGNLRIDYVLPSRQGFTTKCGGVFWPTEKHPSYYLVGPGHPVVSSDHRLVWQDVSLSE